MSAERRRMSVTLRGVSVVIEGPPEAIARLEVLFGLAAEGPAGEARAHLELVRAEPRLALPRRAVADQVVQRGVVYNLDGTTWVRHHGWAVTEYDFAAERGRITGLEIDDLVELAYLAALSRLGAFLERAGYVRIHAAAFRCGERGALFLAPSGGGKSSLVHRLLRADDVHVLGDDVALLDRRGRLHPFPTSVGVRDPDAAEGLGAVHPFPRRFHGLKWVVDSRALADRFADAPARLERVYLGRWVSAPPSRARAASMRERLGAVSRELVVGAGLPQVVELVIPRGARDAPTQLPSLLRRLGAAAQVLASARALTLEVHDPAALGALVMEDLGHD
ncbi:MAG: hypothetical protein RLO52_15840 [Sandaracinaceae bacterium]